MDDCLFCKIAGGKIPAKLVLDEDDVVAFEDINPQAPVHLLVIPRRHVASLNEAKEDDAPMLGRLLTRARGLARAKGIDASGYRVVVNTMAGAVGLPRPPAPAWRATDALAPGLNRFIGQRLARAGLAPPVACTPDLSIDPMRSGLIGSLEDGLYDLNPASIRRTRPASASPGGLHPPDQGRAGFRSRGLLYIDPETARSGLEPCAPSAIRNDFVPWKQ
jgi:histidine triad (HIT) family protein